MKLRVNGQERDVSDEWRKESLLDTLREQCGLTGTRYSCGVGLCGACTVHINGQAVSSCLIPVETVGESEIRTIESLVSKDGSIHPLQQAWIDERVPQCGYCQAGQIMQALALLESNPSPTDDEIDEAMDANLCRCGTYNRIRRAIRTASSRIAGTDHG